MRACPLRRRATASLYPSLLRRLKLAIAPLPVILGLSPAVAAGASAATCSSSGATVPNVGSSDVLVGVAATSSCTAWAVGNYFNGAANQTLVEHWGGKAWKVQSSPNPAGANANNVLSGVVAISRTNAWAVGNSGGTQQTLVEHWDGAAWSVQSSPNATGSTADFFSAVTATSPKNAWAVGGYDTTTGVRTLIEHWNGTAWKIQPSPNPSAGTSENLYAVTATSSKNAWAVGDYYNGTGERTLVEHWNGKAWKIQPSPNAGVLVNGSYLNGVAATSSTDAWAVGYYQVSGGSTTLVEHWNGKHWKLQSSPSPSGSANVLRGVAATSSKNVWAVGEEVSGGHFQTLIEHWNGKHWKVHSSPNPGGPNHDNALQGVAATSSGNAWAVGDFYTGSAFQNIILNWNGKAWKGP